MQRIVLFENDEFISQEIPNKRSDCGNGGGDIAEAFLFDSGIGKNYDYKISQSSVYYETDYADQEKTPNFFVAGLILASKSPIFIPEITADVGDDKRCSFENNKTRAGGYAGYDH